MTDKLSPVNLTFLHYRSVRRTTPAYIKASSLRAR